MITGVHTELARKGFCRGKKVYALAKIFDA
jgi:hypothetical protein